MKTEIAGNVAIIWRERPATIAEKNADPGAKVMVDVVTVTFGKGHPSVVVNRGLCE